MKDYRYIDGVATLALNKDKCVGCGLCTTVCPHRVFEIRDKKTVILDFDACMECGACAQNCPAGALTVTPGVGCASYLISAWIYKLTGKKTEQGCC